MLYIFLAFVAALFSLKVLPVAGAIIYGVAILFVVTIGKSIPLLLLKPIYSPVLQKAEAAVTPSEPKSEVRLLRIASLFLKLDWSSFCFMYALLILLSYEYSFYIAGISCALFVIDFFLKSWSLSPLRYDPARNAIKLQRCMELTRQFVSQGYSETAAMRLAADIENRIWR